VSAAISADPLANLLAADRPLEAEFERLTRALGQGRTRDHSLEAAAVEGTDPNEVVAIDGRHR